MARRKKGSHGWVYFLWGMNGIVIVGLLSAFAFYVTNQRTFAANGSVETSPFNPTRELPPTSYFLPTLTPNPNYTPPVFETSTAFILENGPRPTIIGFSLAGRPIELYTFGAGEREYLIVAGIHGGYEWNTIALANELITHINEHPEVIATDATLYIIRNMNPDGEARAHGVDGRVNNNGVDLNRNFPAENWTAEWDRDGCWIYRPTTGGLYAGSEPETRTVMSFIKAHKIEAMISYHSAALGVFPGGVPWEEPSKRLAKALSKVTRYPYPPFDTGCEYTGTLADWAVENGVGAAVDMELRTHSNTDFDENLKALKVLLSFMP
ncbi:MAG: M14 family metallopeptidase [Anaerolineae bacterium]|nr:M14 family metallopeptidase [Anaerolineae bacterium]MCI0609219.1 M14 family metallopeptidase [Anaerolineae bacterium]